MCKLSESQRQWVEKFFGLCGGGGATSKQVGIQSFGPDYVMADSDEPARVQVVETAGPVGDIPDPEDTEPDEDDVAKNRVAGAEGIKSTAPPAEQQFGQFRKKAAQLRKARQLWLQACDQARKDMVQVKSALRKAYRRDTTQLPLVMQKAKSLDAVFDDQSCDLRKCLDNYIKRSATNTQEMGRLETQLIASLRTITSRINENPLLAAIDVDQDLVPELKIKAPLLDALRQLGKAVAG